MTKQGPYSLQSVAFRVEGVDYVFDAGKMTGVLERELYAATKLTMMSLLDAAQAGAMFAIAGLMFLARRQRGDRVQYATIENDLYAALAASAGALDIEMTLYTPGDEQGPPADAIA